MSAPSPTVEGFRAAFRGPAVTFAEIIWRWSVGATAGALFLFYCVEYIDSLPVSSSDALLLATRQPALVLRAIGHILQGSMNRAVLAALIVALALSVLWIIVASFGRLATVRALLAHFRAAAAGTPKEAAANDSAQVTNEKTEDNEGQKGKSNHPVRTLIDLNFLRVAVVLATILALAGAAILSSFVSTKTAPRPDLASIIFLLIAIVILMTAWFLNWWLSFATILAVRDEKDALGALCAVANLVWERAGSVFAVSIWTGLAHLTALSIGSTALGFALAFLQIAPPRLVLASVAIIALLYFAVADWLCIARIAGYICIAENPAALAAAPLPSATVSGGNAVPYQTSVDREEPILSDLPNLALEV
jgi:hypothetical protein